MEIYDWVVFTWDPDMCIRAHRSYMEGRPEFYGQIWLWKFVKIQMFWRHLSFLQTSSAMTAPLKLHTWTEVESFPDSVKGARGRS